MAPAPWPRRSNFEQYIGDIPDSFRVEKLAPIIAEITEGWLTDILTAEGVSTYVSLFADYDALFYDPEAVYSTTAYPTVSQLQYTTGGLIIQFLTYAVWSAHILRANAVVTDTGIVTKLNPDSDPITDRQRTELSSYYKGLAERKALAISRAIADSLPCYAGSGSGRPTIRKAQPRSPSRLGN